MRENRRAAAACTLAATVVAAVLLVTAGGAAATEIQRSHSSGDNLVAVFNDVDASSVAVAAVDVEFENGGKVDNVNLALARAQCVGCTTAAFALQAVVAPVGSTVAPRNQSDALNTLCDTCVTYAKAGQIVVLTDIPVRLDHAGKERVQALEARLEGLDAQIATMTASELVAIGEAAEAELIAILDQHLVPREL